MSPALQAKLLYVLEYGSVRAIGTSKERTVHVRILAATHSDLRERARTGSFREDLLYRLDVVTIEIPALRHRALDIPPLVERLLADAKGKHPRSPVEGFDRDAMARLMTHSWPGNVRELAHVIERVVLLGRGPEVSTNDLPPNVKSTRPPGFPDVVGPTVIPIRDVQRRYAAWAFEMLGGHKARTADALEVDGKTLMKWLNGE